MPLGNADQDAECRESAASAIGESLRASETIEFAGQSRSEVYGWVEKTLVAQEYGSHGKKGRGAIRAYWSKVTGLSLPQIMRLIRSYVHSGRVRARESLDLGSSPDVQKAEFVKQSTLVDLLQESRAKGVGHLENSAEDPLGQGIEVSALFRKMIPHGPGARFHFAP